jgi:ABC-2 type transport system ATP-binding protein
VVNQAGYYGLNRKVAGERAEKYLKKLGLWDKRKVASRMLSGGMKRRLMIARALVHEPRLLILDEPTAGVDIELRRSMWEFLTEINRSGTTNILTTHYLEEAESLCRHIAIIDAGVIVENTTMKALLKQLQKETFILDVRDGIKTDISIPGFETRMVDEHTLELVLNKGTSLNEVFVALNGSGIEVSSMRNKANRLEELFVALLNAK